MVDIKNIIILGGEGDGVVVASFIHDINNYEKTYKLIGFLNDSTDTTVGSYKVLGNLKDAKKFIEDCDVYFVSALLKTKYSYQRAKLIESLGIPLERFINIIHPLSNIASSVIMGTGNVFGPFVNIMPNVKIGNHCSFRSGASVGHDCIVEDFCYMGPNSTMAGRSIMKRGAHMGPNASLMDRKILQCHSVLGMGSVMTKNSEEFRVYFGVPAKKIGISCKDN